MRLRLFGWILFLCLFSLPGLAQRTTSTSSRDITTPTPEEDEGRVRLTTEMAKKATKERVAALRHDTDKLLRLSVELKESVDKSDENVLSLDVIKKAEEIEKLAHSVREKMKGPN